MVYAALHHYLTTHFEMGRPFRYGELDVATRFYSFSSTPQLPNGQSALITEKDTLIAENYTFDYPVVLPLKNAQRKEAIVLLHGLNERNWSKYLPWATALARQTGKAVILFPIAFHMNRSPYSWSNPRLLQAFIEKRRETCGNDRSISLANVALSQRISEQPLRFYSSGRQSMFDLTGLFRQIKEGKHELFDEDTRIDIFSYSIGAFLAQITLMANPEKLFSQSKLFMFCGGSIFSSMRGESRSIMDKTAFANLQHYFISTFGQKESAPGYADKGFEAFDSMIATERHHSERIAFFEQAPQRIKAISLSKDHVIPYFGIEQALGKHCTQQCVSLTDFPFDYNHEMPFPTGKNTDNMAVDRAFRQTMSTAAEFLA